MPPPTRVGGSSSLDVAAPLIAALLVVVGVAVGIVAGTAARPSSLATPAGAPAPAPSPSPTRDPETVVFAQPLSAGCATASAVWVFSDGGGIGRWDGSRWQLVDPTLRSLVAAACRRDFALAVGPGGSVVTADDARGEIRADVIGDVDLLGLSIPVQGPGAMAVGPRGMVRLQTAGDWQPYAAGIEDDLHAIVAFGLRDAWAVGSGGAAYRLEPSGWRATATRTNLTLWAVAGPNSSGVLAAGDAGALLFNDGVRWRPIASGVSTRLRAAATLGAALWVVGDAGVVLVLDPTGGDHTAPAGSQARGPEVARRVEIGTTCNLRAVFAQDEVLWILGSDGARAGAWRIARDATRRWGGC